MKFNRLNKQLNPCLPYRHNNHSTTHILP